MLVGEGVVEVFSDGVGELFALFRSMVGVASLSTIPSSFALAFTCSSDIFFSLGMITKEKISAVKIIPAPIPLK